MPITHHPSLVLRWLISRVATQHTNKHVWSGFSQHQHTVLNYFTMCEHTTQIAATRLSSPKEHIDVTVENVKHVKLSHATLTHTKTHIHTHTYTHTALGHVISCVNEFAPTPGAKYLIHVSADVDESARIVYGCLLMCVTTAHAHTLPEARPCN